MQAYVIDQFGGPEVFRLAEVPDPQPRPGHVVVEVAATSVNLVDCKVRSGLLADWAPPFAEKILHEDVAGTVSAIGEGVNTFRVGDRVFGSAGGIRPYQGALAERMEVDTRLIAHAPESIDLVDASALPLVAITAAEGLRRVALEDANVLVIGGTGGVGHVALPMARNAGARVVATASTPEKQRIVRELGAEVAVDIRQAAVGRIVEEQTGGRGFDVVFDSVGGPTLDLAIEAARFQGAVVTIMAMQQQDLTPAFLKELSLHMVFMLVPMMHDFNRERHGAILADLARAVDAGQLRPLIDRRLPFSQVAEAHRHAEHGRPTGRVVLVRD